jgi:hypothetical protein
MFKLALHNVFVMARYASSFLLSLERDGEYLFDQLSTNMTSVVALIRCELIGYN